jgi:hypothetical protein
MYYIINSTLRTGEDIIIETRNDIKSNSGNISCQNSLYSQLNFMTEVFGDVLSNTTGETFNASVVNNKLTISSNTCVFQLTGNIDTETTQPYTMLGFNRATLPNAFYSNITAPNNINLNVPIFQSNVLKLDVMKYSFNESISVYPINYDINNLCIAVQNELNRQTGLQWSITYNINTTKIRIELISPNYFFKFFWATSEMANLSRTLGFTKEQTVFLTALTADQSPEILNAFDANIDRIVVNIWNQQNETTIKDIAFSPNTIYPNQFLLTIEQQLFESTGVVWEKRIFAENTLVFVIKQSEEIKYRASILFGDVSMSMSRIAQSFGFSEQNTSFLSVIDASAPFKNTPLYMPNDLFKLRFETIYSINIYNLYQIPFGPPIYNPAKYLKSMNKVLNTITNIPWNIQSNVGSNITNSSYLNIRINDVDSQFRILWGNVLSANIAKSMGFGNTDMSNFASSIIAGNIIDFNYNLNYPQLLNFEIKSNTYYKKTSYELPTLPSEYKLHQYVNSLADKLNDATGQQYSVYLDEFTQKTTISSSKNIYFKFLFGENNMKKIAQLLGFEQVNMIVYSNYITSPQPVNGAITLESTDVFNMIQREDNYDFSKPITISLNEQYFQTGTFISNLKEILDQSTPGFTWTVSISATNILTIEINNPSCAFKFLWGENNMTNIANLFGFNPINQSTFLRSISGNNPINYSIALAPNNVLNFIFREPLPVNISVAQLTSSFELKFITFFSPNYFFNFISSFINKYLSPIIADYPGPLNFSYDSLTKKLTISSPDLFKFGFAPNTNLSKIMGFNFLESPAFQTSITSQVPVDMTGIFLPSEIFILKFLKSITPFSFNYFDFYAIYHKYLLEHYLNNATQLMWTCSYNPSSKKISVYLPSSNFKFITSDPSMQVFSTVYGFDTTNSQTFNKTQTGNNAMSFSTFNGSNLVYLSVYPTGNVLKFALEASYNVPVKYKLYIQPIIYVNATAFETYLQNALNALLPSLNFTVSYNSVLNKYTISNTQSQSIKFRFLFGNSFFVSKLMGFNNSNMNEFSNTIISDKEINLSGQFGKIALNPNCIIRFDKINMIEIKLPELENITDFNNELKFKINVSTETFNCKIKNGFYNSTNFAAALADALNTTGFSFTVVLNNNKITINNASSGFNILWQDNPVLAQMCGFNPINSNNVYVNTLTSDFNIDLNYPKNVYLDIQGVKFNSTMISNNHMFLIGANKSIEAPKNQLDRMGIVLYDENNFIVSPTTNWNATLEFS